jgi:hypothetical protein
MGQGVMDPPRRPAEHTRPTAVPRLPVRPRRRVPHLLLGVLLITVCALVFAVLALRAGGRATVLAVARPVGAGQAITAADLRVVRVAADPGVAVMPAAAAGQVIGRTTAVPLTPGVLLSPDQLGPASFPDAGQAVIGLLVSDGQYPPGLAPGARVAVVLTPEPGVTIPITPVNRLGDGLVVSVHPAADPIGGTRVGLVLPTGDALTVAGAGTGRVVLVALPSGGSG